MIASVVIVGDEGLDVGFEIARQVIILPMVLQRLMPTLDLALRHGVIRRAADMLHVLAVEPFGEVGRDVAGAVVGKKPRPMNDLCLARAEALKARPSVSVTSSAFMVAQSFQATMKREKSSRIVDR